MSFSFSLLAISGCCDKTLTFVDMARFFFFLIVFFLCQKEVPTNCHVQYEENSESFSTSKHFKPLVGTKITFYGHCGLNSKQYLLRCLIQFLVCKMDQNLAKYF